DQNSLWVVRYSDEPRIERLYHFDLPENLGRPRQVEAMDVDGDGDMDILVPFQVKPVQVNVLLNDGRGNLTPGRPLAFPVQKGIRGIAAGVDKDGARYVLASGYYALALYRLSPEGYEMRSLKVKHMESMAPVVLKDVDGDGWLDAVVARALKEEGGLVFYGPLWEHWTALEQQGWTIE
ncbi:MAG: VCBS repeat-containing protein, partial [Gammaproteobacteria bacterium]